MTSPLRRGDDRRLRDRGRAGTTSDVGAAQLLRIPPLAQRLFRDFGSLPASAVFAAIGRAQRMLRDQGQTSPDPQLVEEIARSLLRARLGSQAPRPWFA